jgi:perosamine synthetase
MNWKLPLYKILTDEEDLRMVSDVIKRGQYWTIGPEIEQFENAVKEYVGSKYCIAFNSGTSALHAVLLAYGIKKNDEIIVPSFSFISTVNSVLFVNGHPIFSDIEEETYGLDPKIIEQKITQKTKAIIPMDYGGQSCKMFELNSIANDNNLVLIEDAAEGLGASIKNKKVGSVSETAIFSFCGNKVLTTGEGGAVVTNSEEIHEKLKLLRSHGRVDKMNYFDDPSHPQYLGIGYNWRMSSITAALGLSQINKLEKLIKMRQVNAAYLSSKLDKISKIQTPNISKDNEHIFQMYTIRLPDVNIRDGLQSHLTKKGIFSKVYFDPIHLTAFYKNNFQIPHLPITEKIAQQVISLPIYPNMTNEEKDYLVDSISEFFC